MRADGDPNDRQSRDPHSGVRRMLPRVPMAILLRMRDPGALHAERMAAAHLVFDHVHRVAAVILGRGSSMVDDAAQEAFEAVYRNAPKVVAPDTTPGDLTAWVNAIAARKAIDVLRRTRTAERRHAPQPFGGDELADPVNLPPDDTVATSQIVEHLLAALDPPMRAAIVLQFWGGLTHGEIAEALGLPLGTVKSRLRAALQRLGEHLRCIQADQSYDIEVPGPRRPSAAAESGEQPIARLRTPGQHPATTDHQAGHAHRSDLKGR